MPRILKYAAAVCGLFILLLVLFINQGLAGMAQALYPAAKWWTHGVLAAFEILGLLWLWRGLFGRRGHLSFSSSATEGDQRRFAAELLRRLRANPHLRHVEVPAAVLRGDYPDPEAKEYARHCCAVLRERADAEIRRIAERVFLATALSQNGRIDALIVLLSLCRMVWRISGIFNQRPHPSEVLSLYWAVCTSTFLALSFEELDVATEITVGFGEAFHAMAPATMTGSVPFVGAALQKFTASSIDGAANCFLALRAGIVARDAYAYALEDRPRPGRAAVFKEAGGILLDMSHKLIDQFAKGLRQRLWGLTGSAAAKTAQAGRDLAGGVGRMGESMGAGFVRGASGAVHAAGDAVAGAAAKAGETLSKTTLKTGEAVRKAAAKTQNAVRGAAIKAGETVTDTATKTGSAVADTVTKTTGAVRGAAAKTQEAVLETVSKTGSAVTDAADKTGRAVAEAVTRTGSAVTDAVAKAGEAVTDAAARTTGAVRGAAVKSAEAAAETGRTITRAGLGVVHSAENAGKAAIRTARKAGRAVRAPFRGKKREE